MKTLQKFKMEQIITDEEFIGEDCGSKCHVFDGNKLFSSHRLVLGVAWAQAGRNHMQDSFSINLGTSKKLAEKDFFGVFDGHGVNGESISRHVARNLNNFVLMAQAKGDNLSFPEAVEWGFLLLDAEMKSDTGLTTPRGVVYGGTTACVVWVTGSHIFSGNLGDSRFIMSYNGKAFPVSKDHNPTDGEEMARIIEAGAHLENNRVKGKLAVSRALGDFWYKDRPDLDERQQPVIAVPDVRTITVEKAIDFLVVATDGVWHIKSNQEVVDFITDCLNRTMPLNEIGSALIDSCKTPVNPNTGLGSDNMTIMIAVLRNATEEAEEKQS